MNSTEHLGSMLCIDCCKTENNNCVHYGLLQPQALSVMVLRESEGTDEIILCKVRMTNA